jgi:DNA-binding transcriptional LysR family regulator
LVASLNFRWVEVFRAVAQTGTTMGAAELLKVTQPAVSRHVSALEDHLGFALFDRRQRRLRLTPEGELMLKEAENAFNGLERFRRSADNIRLRKRGHLRLITGTPTARGLVPEALVRFRETYPDVTVSIEVAIRRELAERIAAQQFDLALLALPFEYPEREISPLRTVYGVCVLPSAHPLARKTHIDADDIGDTPFISASSETLGRSQIDDLFERVAPRRNLAFEAQTSTTVCDLVAAGLGLSVVDPFTARASRSPSIAIRPFVPAIPYEYAVLFPLHRQRSALADALHATIHDCLNSSDFIEPV